MEMEDNNQYGIADLSQFINGGRAHFPAIPSPPPPPDLFSGQHHQYDMLMMPSPPLLLHDFRPSSFTAAATTTNTAMVSPGNVTATSSSTISGGLDTETGGGVCLGGGGDNGGTGRWPRQETLTLLEIRSRLDPKFKEANQKGPLWDEISRIMFEEHGYQRNGKKCREKFENLYKYYKKTKEGKAGRQDGKNYRFFRQLEALYGDTGSSQILLNSETHFVGSKNNAPFDTISNNNNNIKTATHLGDSNREEACFQSHHKLCDSLSLSNNNSLEFDTSSDDNSNDLNTTTACMENDLGDKSKKRRGSSKSWKKKVKDFVDSQMRKLIKKQEAWLESTMKTIEAKEQERVLREEERRRQEVERMERVQKFWASERSWIEARDAAFVEALQKFTGKELIRASDASFDQMAATENPNLGGEYNNENEKQGGGGSWLECEITKLIQLRTSMSSRFEQIGCREEVILWEEIATKLSYSGYDRSPLMCKNKWESINNYLTRRNYKEPKENSIRASCYNETLYNNHGGSVYSKVDELPDDGTSPSNSSAAANNVEESGLRFLVGDNGENLWINTYGTKLNKGDRN